MTVRALGRGAPRAARGGGAARAHRTRWRRRVEGATPGVARDAVEPAGSTCATSGSSPSGSRHGMRCWPWTTRSPRRSASARSSSARTSRCRGHEGLIGPQRPAARPRGAVEAGRSPQPLRDWRRTDRRDAGPVRDVARAPLARHARAAARAPVRQRARARRGARGPPGRRRRPLPGPAGGPGARHRGASRWRASAAWSALHARRSREEAERFLAALRARRRGHELRRRAHHGRAPGALGWRRRAGGLHPLQRGLREHGGPHRRRARERR